MSSLSRLKLFHLLHLSKPAADRLIYQEIHRRQPRKIVEVGLGAAGRSLRMLALAAEFHPSQEIQFTAIDLFEGRPDGSGMSLRDAHRTLKATGARIQLVPGDPHQGLARIANALGKVDLLVFSPVADAEQLAQAWFYVPRLLHDGSLVLLQGISANGQLSTRPVEHVQIHRFATPAQRRAA